MGKIVLCAIFGMLIGVTFADEQTLGAGANLVDPQQENSQAMPELINGTSYDDINKLRQESPEQLERVKAILSADPSIKNSVVTQKITNQNYGSSNASPYQCTIIKPIAANAHTECAAEYYNYTHKENKVRCYVDGWN